MMFFHILASALCLLTAPLDDVQPLPVLPSTPMLWMTPHTTASSVRKPSSTIILMGGSYSMTTLHNAFGKRENERSSRSLMGLRGDIIMPHWSLEVVADGRGSHLAQRQLLATARASTTILDQEVGVGVEYAEYRSEQSLAQLHDGALATQRFTRLGWGMLEVGRGDYTERHARLALLTGWYENSYASVLRLPSYEGSEPLALDASLIAGARLSTANIDVSSLRLRGSIQYARLLGHRSRALPLQQWTLSAGGLVPLWSIRASRGLYLGFDARIHDATPTLVPDHSIRTHIMWRFR